MAFDQAMTGAPRLQRGFLLWLLPAYTAMYATYQGVQQILIPAQVEAIDPAAKVENLGLLTSIAALTSIAGLLAGGAISDRTTGRFGRRTPSLAVGAIASALLMLAMANVSSLVTLGLLFAALWFTSNYYQGALTPALPDRVPIERRGTAASVMALGTPFGVIVGVNYAAQSGHFAGYVGLALLLVTATAGFLICAPEGPAIRRPAPAPDALRTRSALASFLSAFRSRDFSLAFAARALMFFSVFNVTGYIYYIAQDFIGTRNLPGQDPQFAVSLLISIQMGACIVSAAAAGWLADRFGRMKLLVAISSIGIAAALFVPVLSPDWSGMIAMELCVGLFFGAYLAVDLALMSLVLPDPDNEGRDMAILAIATGAPQILSPLTGALLIGSFGYQALFLFGALMAVASGLLIFKIKSVR
jgi:MFS family permease